MIIPISTVSFLLLLSQNFSLFKAAEQQISNQIFKLKLTAVNLKIGCHVHTEEVSCISGNISSSFVCKTFL
jgi:hypothetical protein